MIPNLYHVLFSFMHNRLTSWWHYLKSICHGTRSGGSHTQNILEYTKSTELSSVKNIRRVTRVRLGRVAPHGWPRSVYKSNVECHFVSRNDQNDLEGHGQCLPFSISATRMSRCIFGANLVILDCMDKLKFLELCVKMAKMTLKVKVDDIHFQYQLRVSQNARLVPIWWL